MLKLGKKALFINMAAEWDFNEKIDQNAFIICFEISLKNKT